MVVDEALSHVFNSLQGGHDTLVDRQIAGTAALWWSLVLSNGKDLGCWTDIALLHGGQLTPKVVDLSLDLRCNVADLRILGLQ